MSSLKENQNKIPALEAEIVELKAEMVVFKAELKAEGKSASEILVLLTEMTRQLNLLLERRERLEKQTSADSSGAGRQVSIKALDTDLIDRIHSSVLSVSNDSDNAMIATAVVWDYTTSDVLLLTNYHTWDDADFRYCFPPKNNASKRKKTDRDDPVQLTLRNGSSDFKCTFVVTSKVFHVWEKDEDFAVLKLPKDGFTMQRIPVSLGISLTLKIHAFGYIGHTSQFNISGGEVSGFIPEGFTMNLLSAGGFSGAAIIADGLGRAIGYMGGNLDASKDKNSQHQSYGYRFDRVINATKRQATPTNSPAGKGSSGCGKAAV